MACWLRSFCAACTLRGLLERTLDFECSAIKHDDQDQRENQHA